MIMYKVNNFLLKHNNLARAFVRYEHSEYSKVIYPLQSRSLVKVTGNEAAAFLQGLITNDVHHLETSTHSMYAMFLNTKGRVLYDTLIYKWGENNKTFMLECDKSVNDLLQKHLKMYKLRRDVKITDVNDFFNVWALITPPNTDIDCGSDIQYDINIFKDPRLEDLGYRIITTKDVDNFDLLNTLGKDTVVEKNEKKYRDWKYRLGVGEGAEDMFPGACLPLEVNCDYLHGVSFHKGCYIGQELTARVHHTGVVRKRLMPIKFLKKDGFEDMERDSPIWATIAPGRSNVGKLKSYANGYGIGLVRIREAMLAKALSIGLNPVEVIKPSWWPIEAPKEKLAFNKPDDTETIKPDGTETIEEK